MINGSLPNWRINAYIEKALDIKYSFPSITFNHCKTSHNRVADWLANKEVHLRTKEGTNLIIIENAGMMEGLEDILKDEIPLDP